MKVVVCSTLYTEDYVTAMITLLTRAGFYVDTEYDAMDDPEGDLAIYSLSENSIEDEKLLSALRYFDMI